METSQEFSNDSSFVVEDDQPNESSDKSDTCNSEAVDLSGQGLNKLDKNTLGFCRTLILDNNELNKLENVESYGNIRKLSLINNKFIRMYCVCRLIHLRELDISNNNIVVIEGLRELIHLNILRLGGNKIKTIEHMSTNIALEVLDLSNNCITILSDISHLKMLNTLLLNNNNIKQINTSSHYLPASLVRLNLANNSICDLNQVSNLTDLSNLEEFSIANNPCVDLTTSPVAFDYRPFVINWCQSLKQLDGYLVGPKESLKAEWLYSMGKGRQFRIGDHADLIDYLSSICPLTALEDLTSEEDMKLNRILKQRRQYQQQLQTELTTEDKSKARINSAPVLPTAAKSSGQGESLIGIGERSKSALPIRTQSKMPSSSSFSTFQFTPPSTSKHLKSSVGKLLAMDGVDVDDGLAKASDNAACLDFHQNGAYENDTYSFTPHKGEVPSDVPESSYVHTLLESPVATSPLKSETQYVPVPETMLSPDFRPISNSFHSGMYDGEMGGAIGGDGESELPQSWSSWSQPTQSSIPRNVSLHKPYNNKPNISNDWPVAKRPNQVQRVLKATRPLSLSPSNYRRSPAPKHKTSPRLSSAVRPKEKTPAVDDSSSDSDVSMSKLVLVKEAIARKSKDTPQEAKRNHLHIENSNVEVPQQRNETNENHTQLKVRSSAKKERVRNVKPMNGKFTNNVEAASESQIKAATRIQAFWRGYFVRQKRPDSTSVRLEIRLRRAEDHVLALQKQLATTRAELECEKRFRNLQMDAIKSLWAQVQQLQTNYLEENSKFTKAQNSILEYKAEAASLLASSKGDTGTNGVHEQHE